MSFTRPFPPPGDRGKEQEANRCHNRVRLVCKHLQLGLTRPQQKLLLESLTLPRSGWVSPNTAALYHSGPGPLLGVSYVLDRRGCSRPQPDPSQAATLAVSGELHMVQRKLFARGTFPDCPALATVEAKPSMHNTSQEKPREEI